MPALRVGYVHAPKAMVEPIAAAVRATLYSAPPLMARIVGGWIADGTAARLAEAKRAETRRRNSRARHILSGIAGAVVAGDPAAPHLWLTLPEPWRADDFVAAAQRRGVGIIPAAAFAVHAPAAGSRAHLPRRASRPSASSSALECLAELLASEPGRYLSVV